MKNPMLLVLLVCAVGALVRAAFKFYYKEFLPAVLVTVIGMSTIGMIIAFLLALNRLEVPLEAADSADERIVMQVSGALRGNTLYWGLGFFLSAVGIVECPDALWTRWLSYPAAFVFLALVGLVLFIAVGQNLQRIVADSKGIMVLTQTRRLSVSETADAKTRDRLPEPDTRVAWDQVGAVKRVEVRRKTVTSGHHYTENTFVRRAFVLLDHKGHELLDLDEPFNPPDRYQRFLESIPRWTGLQVEEASVRE